MKNKLPYFITTLALLADLAVVFLLSLIQLNFDFSALKQPIFWLNIALTQALIMTAYFALTYLGKQNAEKAQDIISLEKTVNDNFLTIDNNFLTKDLEEFITIENLRMKHEAYIDLLNMRLSKAKTKEERDRLIAEKESCIKWKKFYDNCNYPEKDKLNERPTDDFDISLKRVSAYRINYRQFVSGFETKKGKEIGSFSSGKILFKDSASKILTSIFMTCLFSAISLGALKPGWQGVYDVVWRVFMIGLNGLMGYFEGSKIINVFKKDALIAKKKIQTDFFNKMFTIGKIKQGE